MTEEQRPKVYKSIQEGLLDVAKYGVETYNQKIKMTQPDYKIEEEQAQLERTIERKS